jgi:hypothetical protein
MSLSRVQRKLINKTYSNDQIKAIEGRGEVPLWTKNMAPYLAWEWILTFLKPCKTNLALDLLDLTIQPKDILKNSSIMQELKRT